jgi:hypothetical protein
MPNINLSLEQLRTLIGIRVMHSGEQYQIIEIIESEPGLILQICNDEKPIQENQFGDPTRRAPKNVTIQVLTKDKTEIHPQFLALDLI